MLLPFAGVVGALETRHQGMMQLDQYFIDILLPDNHPNGQVSRSSQVKAL